MKKKICLLLLFLLLFIFILGGFTLFYAYKIDSKISLKEDNITIEYGNTYNPTIEELIDYPNSKFISIDDFKLDNNIENEEGKSYPATGEYEIKVYYKDKIFIQKVFIIDTVAPEISMINVIEIPYNTDLSTYNFNELVKVSDLSEVNDYKINFDNVNSAISGEYVAKIMVDDVYSNKSEKEFKIKVQEKQEESIIKTSNNTQTNEINTKEIKNNPTKNNNSKKETSVQVSTQTNTKTNTQMNEQTNTKANTETNTQVNTKKEETKQEVQQVTPVRCTNNNNHALEVGNSEKWFNSKDEAIAVYKEKRSYWGDLWTKYQIDDDTYYKNCPSRI